MEKTAKIVILGPAPPPYSGPEVMTLALVAGVSHNPGMSVKYLDTQVSRSVAEKGGKHQLRKSLSAAHQTAKLVHLMLTFSPDLVYLPLTNSPSFLGFLRDALFMISAIIFEKKIAIRMHGGYYVYAHKQGWRRTLVRALLKRVSLAMVQGRRLKGVFNDLVPESRVAIIPNDIDDAPFLEARKRLPVAPDHSGLKRVLFVGFMAPSKGFRDVIAAIPLTPGAHFVFMGEWLKPEDEKEVRSLLRQQCVEERVTFTGSVSGSKKYDLFVSADIFVLPTYYAYEGNAVSSVEALAAGLPIVCTDHGALNESVQDGWNGFFLPPSDPAAIGRRLNQLIQDEALRRTMGERSRQLYLERFTLAQFVDSWSRAIQACCKGNYPWPGE